MNKIQRKSEVPYKRKSFKFYNNLSDIHEIHSAHIFTKCFKNVSINHISVQDYDQTKDFEVLLYLSEQLLITFNI